MLCSTFESGMPNAFWQYSLMRLLAWCIRTILRSAGATPLRARISCATSIMCVVAILKTWRPSITGMCSPRSIWPGSVYGRRLNPVPGT
jgi:hypothetical protein